MEKRSHPSPLVLEKAKAWGSGGALWSSPPPRPRASIAHTLPSTEASAAINKDGRVEAGRVQGEAGNGRLAGCPVLSEIGWRKSVEGKEKDEWTGCWMGHLLALLKCWGCLGEGKKT